MPRRNVLVIGSGPIVIGQAAEFDYAGVQACRALREEGHRVVLVNSNPATIMTDPQMADAVYLEPLTVGVGDGGDRTRASRRAAADARRSDRAQPRGRTLGIRRPRPLRRRAARHAGRDDQTRRGPRALQGGDDRDRRAGPAEHDRHRHRGGRRVRARPSATRSSCGLRTRWAAPAAESSTTRRRCAKRSSAGSPRR